MRLEELDLPIPEGLIAQEPVEPRDSCRLLRLTADGRREHRVFSELPGVLRPGDTLVFNDSKVLPARVVAHRATGGKVLGLMTGGAAVPRMDRAARTPGRKRGGGVGADTSPLSSAHHGSSSSPSMPKESGGN